MAQETEYRLETLETVLAEFIMQTNRSLNRMERDTADFKAEMQRSREEQQRNDEQRIAELKAQREEQQRNDEQRMVEMQRNREEQQRNDEQRMAELKAQREVDRAETSRQIRDMNQKWSEIAEKLGTFAEDIAAPNLRRIAREQFGCESIDYYSVRIDKRNPLDPSQTFEFDAILVADQTVFLLESKFTVRMKYLEGLPRLIQNFKTCFPEYDTYKLIPVFASMSIQPDQVKYLTNQRIYAMALGEETMELLNFDELQGR